MKMLVEMEYDECKQREPIWKKRTRTNCERKTVIKQQRSENGEIARKTAETSSASVCRQHDQIEIENFFPIIFIFFASHRGWPNKKHCEEELSEIDHKSNGMRHQIQLRQRFFSTFSSSLFYRFIFIE